MKQEITQFSHNHKLSLRDRATSYNCNICNQMRSGWFYGCNWGVQWVCWFADHMLLFSSAKVPAEDFCNVCGENCAESFKYKCAQCSFLLVIKCSLPTLTKKDSKSRKGHHHLGKNNILDQQYNHSHPLIICNKGENLSYACTWCDLAIDGDSPVSVYVYVCLECKA